MDVGGRAPKIGALGNAGCQSGNIRFCEGIVTSWGFWRRMGRQTKVSQDFLDGQERPLTWSPQFGHISMSISTVALATPCASRH